MIKTKDDKNRLKEENIKKFIRILKTANGGCVYCVIKLLDNFIKEFPQYKKLVEKDRKKLKKEIEKF